MKRLSPIVLRVPRRTLPAPVVVPMAAEETEYLDMVALCEWLGVSPTTIREWRKRDGFPTIEHAGFVRYRRESVRQWLNARESGEVPTPIRRVS